MAREARDLGIPAFCGQVVLGHAIAELHQSVLDMAGVLFIAEIFTDLLLRERAAKPSAPPEQEGHEHDEPGGEEKDDPATPAQTEGALPRVRGIVRRNPCAGLGLR